MNTSGGFPTNLSDPCPAFPPPPGPPLGNPPPGGFPPPENPSPPSGGPTENPLPGKGSSGGPLPGEGSGWSGLIALCIAASSGSIICPVTRMITLMVCSAAVAACTVTVLLIGICGEIWSDSASTANCCSLVLGGAGDRTWICSGLLAVVSSLVSEGTGVWVLDVCVSDSYVIWQSSSAVNSWR